MKHVSIEHRDGALVAYVMPKELVDVELITTVGDELVEALNAGPERRMLIDLSGVRFVSSLMVGKLVLLSQRCKARRAELRLCRLTPAVDDIFQLLNLTRLMNVHATQAEAFAAFQMTAAPEDTCPQQEPIETVRQRAEGGDASCQYELGQRYAEGRGVPEDFAQALNWLHKAAAQQHASAQFALGTAYAYGMHVPQDYDQAIAWYRKAADQGHDEAQYQLGTSYANGLAVPQDYAVAVAWFRRAAEAGNRAAQASLAGLYHEGLGVDVNLGEATRWYRKAAEQGDARAAELLKSLSD